MSSSNDNSAIFLTDTPEQIQEKITEHAFSGGQMTKKLQEEKGADLDVDVAFQWLCFFMEDDDELERIRESYGSGKGEYWSTALVKNRLIKLLKELVAEHLEAERLRVKGLQALARLSKPHLVDAVKEWKKDWKLSGLEKGPGPADALKACLRKCLAPK